MGTHHQLCPLLQRLSCGQCPSLIMIRSEVCSLYYAQPLLKIEKMKKVIFVLDGVRRPRSNICAFLQGTWEFHCYSLSQSQSSDRSSPALQTAVEEDVEKAAFSIYSSEQ